MPKISQLLTSEGLYVMVNSFRQDSQRWISVDGPKLRFFANSWCKFPFDPSVANYRLALHGIAPWQKPAVADADGRMICYFRPETPSPEEWLMAP